MSALEKFVARYEFGGAGPQRTSVIAGRVDLCYLFAALGYKRGAEVGVWKGNFSARICAANRGVHLLCVDPWQQYDGYRERKNDQARMDAAYAEACHRLEPHRCEIIRNTSVEAASRIPDRSLDFVYIDGNHAFDYVMADLFAWIPKVRPGGIIAGHDFGTPTHPDVQRAVMFYTTEHAIAPWYVLASDEPASFFWEVR